MTIAQAAVTTSLSQEAISIPKLAIDLYNYWPALVTEQLGSVAERLALANEEKTVYLC